MLPDICPCCSGQPYQQCCAPLHAGAPADSPKALMRSRFAAHAIKDLEYIVRSWASAARADIDREALAQWLSAAEFGQLMVRQAQGDTVEFECWYQQDGLLHHLHDLSHFVQEDGHWRYARSEPPKLKATVVGRNDRCPCGSGKKHKQCCLGAMAAAS
ncbi:YchJ family protein [Simiduia aestuariiviva]|uniref:SEC-C motif-containing protein n=1 Tax=Simiduia aestuariiviva TaxID=1510459 RepID=A0A839UQD6_9GAMM|nr:YchJ family metal-binding protein [Simiduia aestuariiviva]MBB3167758.1 SEC-C motif-containing protein [Simiduia aestuariiviva]